MSPITCMQTPPPHLAGNTSSQPRPSLLSPLLFSSLFFFLSHLHFLIKTTLVSFTQRRCHIGSNCQEHAHWASPTHTHIHKSVPSARCIISPCYLYARPTSPQQVDPFSPLTREAAATSCIYITHHLLHPPISSRSREADLGST